MKTDTLKRRLRTEPPNPAMRPLGAPQRLGLTDADYRVFEALDRHGPLPIHYLFEFQKVLRPSYRHFQYRLRDLYHGDKEGGYLARPGAQFAAYEARYQHLVYDLCPRGKEALAERGTISRYAPRRYDPFVHQLMAACITASIELGAPECGVRFISKEEILSRPSCPEETRDCGNPLAIEICGRRLIPDGMLGLEYPGEGFRFFALEADRNTESLYSRRSDATTFGKKIELYQAVLRDRLYKSRWGIPNLTILTVTTSERHAKNLIAHLGKQGACSNAERFLFQSEPAFGPNWRVPKALLSGMIAAPWRTVGGTKKIVSREAAGIRRGGELHAATGRSPVHTSLASTPPFPRQ